jgi:predicted Holliday junction resolvase-like endonuclease
MFLIATKTIKMQNSNLEEQFKKDDLGLFINAENYQECREAIIKLKPTIDQKERLHIPTR